MGIFEHAQPNNEEPVEDETDEANEAANIQSGDGSSEELDEELVVISTEPSVNTTEPTTNKTEKTANNTKPSVNETNNSANNTKESTNNTKQSSNSSKQSAKRNEPKSANNTKQSINITKKSVNNPNESFNSTNVASNGKKEPANSTEPITFGTPYLETDFTGRLSELASLNRFFLQAQLPTSIMARICVVVGMTGIGKTQLASKFIVENRSAYQNVIWIDSESSQSINDSFKKLVEKINENGERGDVKTVIKDVLNRFCKKNTLFVYDNVRTIESIKFALIATSPVEGPHVLITSPLENWDDRIKVIRMQAWINNDAVEFVSKKLDNIEDKQADITRLVNELKCVPLALRLATAYIMYHRVTFDRFEISDYLSAIKCENFDDDYEKTIFIASSAAIRAIQKNQTRGIQSLKILNIIAYFAPNNIQRDFFSHVINSEQDSCKIDKMERVDSASRLLTNYAMVTFDKEDTQQHLNIHRSIQEVLKCRLREAEGKIGEELLLEDALKLISDLSTTFPIEAIVSHAVSVFQSAKNHPHLVNKWSTLPAIILLKLLNKYPDDENVPSSQQLKERIQQVELLQRQLIRLEEQDSDTVTILAVLALQYLSKEIDSNFWKSWKFAVSLVVVGIVAVSVIKQYERAAETATKAKEAAVSKAIEETNQKWITVVGGIALGILGLVIGVKS